MYRQFQNRRTVRAEFAIMDKEVTIVGKFYLRNGNVIDEKIIFDKDDNKEDIEKTIKDVRDMIKKGFREDYNFQFTFGFTTFRGNELVAVKIEEEE